MQKQKEIFKREWEERKWIESKTDWEKRQTNKQKNLHCISSSLSSCADRVPKFSLLPSILIIYRSWQVFEAASCVSTELTLVFVGHPTLAYPCAGVHKRMQFMSLILVSPVMPSMVCLIWMVCEMGSKWLYSYYFVGCCFYDLFKTTCSILVYFPFRFFSPKYFVSVHVVHPYLLATVVKGDLKSPFPIATTPSCRVGRYSFPWIAPLNPWSVPYNAEC